MKKEKKRNWYEEQKERREKEQREKEAREQRRKAAQRRRREQAGTGNGYAGAERKKDGRTVEKHGRNGEKSTGRCCGRSFAAGKTD